jgi:pyrroline-5-carboxylate reductase
MRERTHTASDTPPSSPLAGRTLGFVGAGNMAEAFARGLFASGLASPGAVLFHDPDPARSAVFADLGCTACAENRELASRSDMLILAVKPQVLPEVLAGFADAVPPGTLVVSIAMGVPCARLEAILGPGARVVRVMPNTPLMVGRGVSGVARGANATDRDMADVLALFASSGLAREVAEDDLHAVTALSGSGPAYVFLLCELMAKAGESLGLGGELAEAFARETVIGAGRLLEGSDEPAEALRRRVTSKGGTTEAALNAFAEKDFEGTVRAALEAAARRSREVS